MQDFQKETSFEKCNLEVITFDVHDVITTSGPVDGFNVEDGGYFDNEGNFVGQ